MEKERKTEKAICDILGEYGINPMLQPNCCEEILKASSHYQLLEALKEAKETIAWMWENFSIDDKNNQSDAFNIPANTLEQIQVAIKNAEA